MYKHLHYKNMKYKPIIVVLTAVMVISLAACGKTPVDIQAPDGNVLYSGNGQNAKDFTVNIAESGSYTMTVKAQSATGFIHIQTENQ